MNRLWDDFRFGIRVLHKDLLVTAVAVLTLGLGIAANTTVFSWMDTVLLRPIPGAGEAGGLLALETVKSDGEVIGNFSYIDFLDYQRSIQGLSELAVARHTPLNTGDPGKAERLWGELVSGNYFDVLRVNPQLGRTFSKEESGNVPEAWPVAVISHNLWKNTFRADLQVVGKTISVNFRELTIIGVAPEGFSGSTPGLSYDIWMPVTMAPAMGTGASTLKFRGTRDLTTTFARLKPGTTLSDAAGEILSFSQQLALAEPRTNRGITVRLLPISEAARGAQPLLRGPLRVLMAVSFLLFLIVCANVANLLLVRFASRRKEIGIRLSLGASRRRIFRQLLVETFLLAVAGGALGIILSAWMAPSLGLLLPPIDFPIHFSSSVAGYPLAFTLVATLVATILCGAVPALACLRQKLNLITKVSDRGNTAGRSTGRLRSAIVIAEVALASVTIVGTGLFLASFRNITSINPGFSTKDALVGQFYLSPLGYSAEQQREFCFKLHTRLRQQAGVSDATYADTIPLQVYSSPFHQVQVEGYTPAKGVDLNIHRSLVAPGYFAFLGIPILEGREFDERDTSGAPNVVIVNQTFAKRYFEGRNPVGRRVQVENRWATVAGLVQDSKYHSLAEGPTPYFYRPFQQEFAPGLNFSFFLKSSGDAATAFATLRREAIQTDLNAHVYKAMPLEESILFSSYPEKVATYLLSGLGLASVLLAALGLFGVISYAVAQRTPEIAIRIALGSTRTRILWTVLPQGACLVGTGIVLGMGIVWAAGRQLESLLVGVSPHDLTILAGAAGLMLFVGAAASLIPAWRSTQTDPAQALRSES